MPGTTTVLKPADEEGGGDLAPREVAITLAGIAGAELQPAQVAAAVEQQQLLQMQTMMALKAPRDEPTCFQEVTRALQIQETAEKAEYILPFGDRPRGASVYLARLMMARWGHMRSGYRITEDTGGHVKLRCEAWDIQRGIFKYCDRSFSTMVKRSVCKECGARWKKQDGCECRAGFHQRLVTPEPHERDQMIAAQGARGERNVILQALPDDRVRRALQVARATKIATAEKDPAAMLDRILMQFDQVGVSAGELESFLGKPLSGATAAELADLRGTYESIRSRDIDWKDTLETALAGRKQKPPTGQKVTRREGESPESVDAREGTRQQVHGGEIDPGAAAVAELEEIEGQRPDWQSYSVPQLRRHAEVCYGTTYPARTLKGAIVADLEGRPWPPPQTRLGEQPAAVAAADETPEPEVKDRLTDLQIERLERMLRCHGDEALATAVADRLKGRLNQAGYPTILHVPKQRFGWLEEIVQSTIARAQR